VLQDWMPLNWAFDLYRHVVLVPSDPDWGGLLEAALVCTLMVVALYGLACLALWWQDE